MRIPTNWALLFGILFLLSISLTSAEILISQPEVLYNMGDDFSLTIKVNSPIKDISDFLTADLICDNETIELYRSPHTINKGAEKEVVISTTFGRFIVSGVQGKCFVKAQFSGESAESQRFDLSSNIDVSLNIEGILFGPGEEVKVSGTAKKSESKQFNGFVEFTIESIALSFISKITDGSFNANFTIPTDAPSGTYAINARAYEKDEEGEIINEGLASTTIRIKSLMKEVEIALDSQTITPKNELTYTIIIYDQSRSKVAADVPVTFYAPDDSILKKEVVKTDEINNLLIGSNFTPGYWKIEAHKDALQQTRNFIVEEFPEVSFSLLDSTLIVTNTGNIPYSGPLEITIGEITEIKEIENLKVGAQKQYKLVAPDGEYSIEIGDGSRTEALGTSFLTGSVISVEDIGLVLGGNLAIVIALIVILIIGIAALYLYRRYSKNKLPKSKQIQPMKTNQPSESSSLIDKGEKQESSIISLKIKDSSSLQDESSKTIETALWKAKEAGAKIYVNGEFRIIIFAPVLTKEKDNSLRAVRTAQTIERILTEYNRRSAKKIDFGVGVGVGDIIVELKEGKFKFMSINNTIASTKNIAQSSNSEVLISEKLHRYTAGKVKTEKRADNIWKVISLSDRSDQKDFLRNMGAK